MKCLLLLGAAGYSTSYVDPYAALRSNRTASSDPQESEDSCHLLHACCLQSVHAFTHCLQALPAVDYLVGAGMLVQSKSQLLLHKQY